YIVSPIRGERGNDSTQLPKHARHVCFFFQAEDGIRDRNVTGVQTCALPISLAPTTRAGSGAWNNGSTRTAPVNHSAGPLPEGCEPPRLMSMRPIVAGPRAPV